LFRGPWAWSRENSSLFEHHGGVQKVLDIRAFQILEFWFRDAQPVLEVPHTPDRYKFNHLIFAAMTIL
jgi:hypothetical protein